MEKNAGIFALYHNNYKLPEPPKFWNGEYVILPPTMKSNIQDKK